MFSFQPMKRRRDDDSDSESDRYLKKSRSWAIPGPHDGPNDYSRAKLPLRPSFPPSPPQGLLYDVLTPAQSPPSEGNSPTTIQENTSRVSSPHKARVDKCDESDDMDIDMDMDEADFGFVGSPLNSPITHTFQQPARPAKLDSTLFGRDSSANITGRIPTPMYPSFAAARGPMDMDGMNGLGYPGSGMAGGVANGYLGIPSNPILRTPPVPSAREAQIVQDRSRRMPSPISEDEDLPDTPTALTQSQLERLSVTSMDMEPVELPPPGSATTPTRGRKRSGALSGKGRFSMGYRDDCEKCRQRVPGHYSHFLP